MSHTRQDHVDPLSTPNHKPLKRKRDTKSTPPAERPVYLLPQKPPRSRRCARSLSSPDRKHHEEDAASFSDSPFSALNLTLQKDGLSEVETLVSRLQAAREEPPKARSNSTRNSQLGPLQHGSPLPTRPEHTRSKSSSHSRRHESVCPSPDFPISSTTLERSLSDSCAPSHLSYPAERSSKLQIIVSSTSEAVSLSEAGSSSDLTPVRDKTVDQYGNPITIAVTTARPSRRRQPPTYSSDSESSSRTEKAKAIVASRRQTSADLFLAEAVLSSVPEKSSSPFVYDAPDPAAKPMDWTPLLPDYVVAGDVAGVGAFGQVKLGTDSTSNEKVAIKGIYCGEKQRSRVADVLREIRINKVALGREPFGDGAASAEDVEARRHIVRFRDAVEGSPVYFLIFDAYPDGDLGAQFNPEKPLRDPILKRICKHVCLVLRLLRRRGIVHRDLNPNNILSYGRLGRKNARYMVGDLGLSVLSSDPGSEKSCRDVDVGTHPYKAPEVVSKVLMGSEGYGSEADLWSLGITLLYFATGRTPTGYTTDGVGMARDLAALWRDNMISKHGINVIEGLLKVSRTERLTAEQVLQHDWMKTD